VSKRGPAARIRVVKEYVRTAAPEDAGRTLDWLSRNGWEVVDAVGVESESLGNVRIEFADQGD
jgi:hypothetical protein